MAEIWDVPRSDMHDIINDYKECKEELKRLIRVREDIIEALADVINHGLAQPPLPAKVIARSNNAYHTALELEENLALLRETYNEHSKEGRNLETFMSNFCQVPGQFVRIWRHEFELICKRRGKMVDYKNKIHVGLTLEAAMNNL
jgi:hypothetical protein